jgi:hypothetical protein
MKTSRCKWRMGRAHPAPFPVPAHRGRLGEFERGNATHSHTGEMEDLPARTEKAVNFARLPEVLGKADPQ